MSLKEIAECFDQTYNIVEEIANLGTSKNLLLFVKGVPNKIAQHILRRLNLLDLNKEKDDLVRVNNKTGFRSDIVVPPTMDDNALKAVKADDALIENSIWDKRVLRIFPYIKYTEDVAKSLNTLKHLFVQRWRYNVRNSFYKYLRNTYGMDWKESKWFKQTDSELNKDLNVFKRCMEPVRGATWFEWTAGSTLFFWM